MKLWTLPLLVTLFVIWNLLPGNHPKQLEIERMTSLKANVQKLFDKALAEGALNWMKSTVEVVPEAGIKVRSTRTFGLTQSGEFSFVML